VRAVCVRLWATGAATPLKLEPGRGRAVLRVGTPIAVLICRAARICGVTFWGIGGGPLVAADSDIERCEALPDVLAVAGEPLSRCNVAEFGRRRGRPGLSRSVLLALPGLATCRPSRASPPVPRPEPPSA